MTLLPSNLILDGDISEVALLPSKLILDGDIIVDGTASV